MPLPNRLTNAGRPLRSHYFGGESDTIREIPPEFRAALDLTVIEIPLPWDQDIIPLSDTVLASKSEQKQTSEWQRRTTYKPPGQVTLGEFLTNKNKQIVTRNRTFKTIGDGTSSPGPFTDVKTQNLGNYHFIEDVENAMFVFGAKTTTAEIPDLLPEIFKALIPMYETKVTFTGIVADPQILGTGEFRRSETQDDVFNETRDTRSRGAITYPQNVISLRKTTEDYGGEVVKLAGTLDIAPPAVDTGLGVVNSEVRNLGNGTYFRQTEEWDIATQWPLLHGQDYDEKFDVVLPYFQQVIQQGTLIGTPRLKITPKDQWREEVRQVDVTSITTILATYVMQFPGTRNLSLPPVLLSVNAVKEVSSGAGATSTPVSFGYWTEHGAYSVPVRADSQASAAAVIKTMPIIQQSHAELVPTTHYMFFLPSPVHSSDVLARLTTLIGGPISIWPVFHLRSAAIFAVGEKLNIKVNAESHQSDGGNASDGACECSAYFANGVSHDVGVMIESTHIPPTIHDVITPTGDTAASITVTAACDASLGGSWGLCGCSGGINTRTETGTIGAGLFTVGLDATVPTAIPSSGMYLLRSDAEIYKYGYVSIHAEVLDASVL